MIIRFYDSEGRQYKVGSLDITGNKLFTREQLLKGVTAGGSKMKLDMTPGKTFKPAAFSQDEDTLRDLVWQPRLSGFRPGRLDPHQRRPRPQSHPGTIDISYNIDEGEKCYIERIIIKGNTKTKDRVLRRELAVYPGEVYDMVG